MVCIGVQMPFLTVKIHLQAFRLCAPELAPDRVHWKENVRSNGRYSLNHQ